jgi:hypothetical protein
VASGAMTSSLTIAADTRKTAASLAAGELNEI